MGGARGSAKGSIGVQGGPQYLGFGAGGAVGECIGGCAGGDSAGGLYLLRDRGVGVYGGCTGGCIGHAGGSCAFPGMGGTGGVQRGCMGGGLRFFGYGGHRGGVWATLWEEQRGYGMQRDPTPSALCCWRGGPTGRGGQGLRDGGVTGGSGVGVWGAQGDRGDAGQEEQRGCGTQRAPNPKCFVLLEAAL